MQGTNGLARAHRAARTPRASGGPSNFQPRRGDSPSLSLTQAAQQGSGFLHPTQPAIAGFFTPRRAAMPIRPYLVRAGTRIYIALTTSACTAIVEAMALFGALRVSARPLPGGAA